MKSSVTPLELSFWMRQQTSGPEEGFLKKAKLRVVV